MTENRNKNQKWPPNTPEKPKNIPKKGEDHRPGQLQREQKGDKETTNSGGPRHSPKDD